MQRETREEARAGAVKYQKENAESENEFCDMANCLNASNVANWVEWIIYHNSALSTNFYTHYCDRCFKVFYYHYGRRRMEVKVLG